MNMYKTADHTSYKLASLEVNLQGCVAGLQAEATPAIATAHAFAMQWEIILKSFRAPGKELSPGSSAGQEKTINSQRSLSI